MLNEKDPGMAPEVRKLWDPIKQEVYYVHERWHLYRQLFGISGQRVELLNRAAPGAFRLFQDALMLDVQLTLSKLTEQNRKSLTLRALMSEVNRRACIELKTTLARVHSDYLIACEKIVDRRNKRLAHFELRTFLNKNSAAMLDASRQEIEDALAALREFMNAIQRDLEDCETSYRTSTLIGNGESLLRILRWGMRYRELRQSSVIDDDHFPLWSI